MSEIEKMMQNAGIKPIKQGYCDWDSDCPYPDIINNGCGDECPYWKYEDEAKYPPFTAEKQIELIKTIETKCDMVDCLQIAYRPMEDLWKISIIPVLEMAFEEMYLYFGCDKDFSTALAMAINKLWQDLTEVEKQQVKGILE